jgi:hypothetical protein
MSDQFWFNKTSDPGPRNANSEAIREGCVADEAPVTFLTFRPDITYSYCQCYVSPFISMPSK